MKNVNIGLDIGIASVGWSILDAETFEIINHGVRLFNHLETNKGKLVNEKRREKRSLRRQIRRKQNLKLDFIKLLQNKKIISLKNVNWKDSNDIKSNFLPKYITNSNNDILKLRLKGIKKKLTKEELIKVLYWYLGLRGIRYELANVNTKAKKEWEKSYAEYFKNKKFIAEIQNDFFKKENYFRGNFNANIKNEEYLVEIKKIFEISNDEFNILDDFINLFKRQRYFGQGPGSKKLEEYQKIKSQKLIHEIVKSPFNRLNRDSLGDLKLEETMWDKSIGRCFYTGKPRAPKYALSSSLYNILNWINGIQINGERIDTNSKYQIIKFLFELKTFKKEKLLEHIANRYDVDIKGIKTLKDKDISSVPHFNCWENIKNVIKKEVNINFEDFYDKNLMPLKASIVDQLIVEFSKTQEIDERKKIFKKLNLSLKWNLKDETIEKLLLIKDVNGTHNFSTDFMINQMIPSLYNSVLNQMQIIYRNENIKPFKMRQGNSKYLKLDWTYDSTFNASPTTKRAIRQTFKVLNRIIKLHSKDYKVNNIIVEMARELNAKDRKKQIDNINKILAERNQKLNAEIEDYEQKMDKKIYGQAFLKLFLYKQQLGKDAYTGKSLDKEKVMFEPGYVDIDHIIPYSQSFENSIHNLALTLKIENQNKIDKTPYRYLSKENFDKMKLEWDKWYKSNSDSFFNSQKKYDYITSTIDYSDPRNALDFFPRNLNDVRYITRETIINLEEFITSLSSEHIFKNTKIKTINGKMTNFARKMIGKLNRPTDVVEIIKIKRKEAEAKNEQWKIKDRIFNGHHAEDATIIVHLALKNYYLNKMIEKKLSAIQFTNKEKRKRAEEFVKTNWYKKSNIDFKFIREELNKNMDKIKFSFMINKRKNFQISDDKIIGIRYIKNENNKKEEMWKIDYIDIKKLNNPKKADKIFDSSYFDNENRQIPMKKHDPKTWNKLACMYKNNGIEKRFYPLDSSGALIVNNRKIKKIKVLEKMKNTEDILYNQFHNTKPVSFKTSLKFFSLRLFQDQNGKRIIIPITILNAKLIQNKETDFKLKLQEEEDKIKMQMEKLNIKNDAKFIKLEYGTTLQDSNNNLYKVTGYSIINKTLEIKPLWRQPKNENDRIRQKPNSKYFNNWKILETDELGNVHKYYSF